ncbi:MAG: hypothetical protein RSA54_13450 [Glutamicibacter sp.]|uniref:hypothetical protein n=1 Tax=Stenotrophomonas sp. TaxID=69392 RepID=UPI002FC91E0B
MESKYKVVADNFSSAISSKVCYDDGELHVFGCNSSGEHTLEIAFDSVVFVRVGDEGGRLRLFGEMGGVRGGIVVCDHSDLLTWLVEESLGARRNKGLRHYVLMMGEEIIDVVSGYYPAVRFLSSG